MIITWNEVNQDNSGQLIWQDVTRHCTSWRNYYFSGDYMTTTHETTHGVNADIRNSTGGRVNAFYMLRNSAIVVNEPNFSKSAVAQYVPDNLKGDRYSMYVEGMTEWNDRPLYLWDEYTAYTNGAYCAAEIQSKEWSDWAMGPLEFSVYSLAVMAACKKYDTACYNTLREDFPRLWLRGMKSFFSARGYFPWDKQDQYLASLQSMTDSNLLDVMKDMNLYVPAPRK